MRAIDLPGGTEILSREDSLSLLALGGVGRIGVVVDGSVEILPVNYTMDGEQVVFRSNFGRKLIGARGPCTFEVDDFDHGSRSGWSVVVHGTAEATASPDPPRNAGVGPWAGQKEFEVRISPDSVTGRRVSGSSPS